MKKFVLTASATLAIALGVAAAPASALTPYSVGVKDVDVAPTTDACVPDQALPCTLDSGSGSANVLRITQHETVDTAEMRYSRFTTTADDGDDLWMAARIGAECKTGHKLAAASFRPDYRYDTFRQDLEEVTEGWHGVWVGVPNAKLMPTKTVALNIPVEEAFEAGDGFTLDFETIQDVYAAGEDRIDDLVSSGMTEEAARALPYQLDTWLEMHADVRCRSNIGDRVYVKRMPVYLPLAIEFVPAPVQATIPTRPPAQDQSHGTGLSIPEGVTHASIAVVPDPEDPCTLHLSGSITASVDTEVQYRFIDEYGQRSNGFSIDVTDDQTAFFSHEVAVPGSTGGDDGPGFTTLDQHGSIDDYGVEDTDLESGTYQLEVFSPNLVLSNIDGYNVPAC